MQHGLSTARPTAALPNEKREAITHGPRLASRVNMKTKLLSVGFVVLTAVSAMACSAETGPTEENMDPNNPPGPVATAENPVGFIYRCRTWTPCNSLAEFYAAYETCE